MTTLQPVTRRLIGDPVQVANVLRAARARGHLLHCGRPEPLSGHRVAITITLLEPVRAARRPFRSRTIRPRRPRHTAIAAEVLAAVILAGLAWLLVLAALWVQANWVPLACVAAVTALAVSAARGKRR